MTHLNSTFVAKSRQKRIPLLMYSFCSGKEKINTSLLNVTLPLKIQECHNASVWLWRHREGDQIPSSLAVEICLGRANYNKQMAPAMHAKNCKAVPKLSPNFTELPSDCNTHLRQHQRKNGNTNSNTNDSDKPKTNNHQNRNHLGGFIRMRDLPAVNVNKVSQPSKWCCLRKDHECQNVLLVWHLQTIDNYS